jgi:hypothetical protein
MSQLINNAIEARMALRRSQMRYKAILMIGCGFTLNDGLWRSGGHCMDDRTYRKLDYDSLVQLLKWMGVLENKVLKTFDTLGIIAYNKNMNNTTNERIN